jgi:hypothetical protein
MKLRFIAASALLVGALAGCGQPEDTELGKAYTDCTDPQEDGKPIGGADALELADEGHTLIIETEGEDDMDGYLAYLCVVSMLDTSERVTSSIETTTSMMGRQTATDPQSDLEYEYSYHPDNGLYVLIADEKS